METFVAFYLIVGIILASYCCGLLDIKSPTIADRIGLVFFFAVIVAGWPMVVAFLAPAWSKKI